MSPPISRFQHFSAGDGVRGALLSPTLESGALSEKLHAPAGWVKRNGRFRVQEGITLCLQTPSPFLSRNQHLLKGLWECGGDGMGLAERSAPVGLIRLAKT